jgi:site-specific DNA recombinase
VVDVQAAWQPGRLSKLLKNTVYAGVHNLKSQRGSIARAVPALVDKTTWDAVQDQLRRNQCLPKNTVHRLYLLRSLIKCGVCDTRFIGTPHARHRKAGTRMEYYYRCGTHSISHLPTGHTRCPAKSLKAEWIEDLVWQDCRTFILHPEEALTEVQRQLDGRIRQSEQAMEEHQRLQHALGEKALERDRIMTLFRRGRIAFEEAEKQLDAIESEAITLRTTLSAIQAQRDLADAFAAHYHEATALLSRLREQLESVERTNDMEAKRRVVELLVAGIRVDTAGTASDKHTTVEITYTFTPRRVVDSTTLWRN